MERTGILAVEIEGLQIRKAATTDIAAIVDLSGQLGYPTTLEQVLIRLAEIMQRPEHLVMIAELKTGEIAGWIHVTRTVWLEIDPYAEIGGLVVDCKHRSIGIGKALLDQAESWARENGLYSLRVRSNIIRNRAHHFYKKAGYQIIKSQHVFEKIFHTS